MLVRVDDSVAHAFHFRQKFAAAVSQGESGINLAEAALFISAECASDLCETLLTTAFQASELILHFSSMQAHKGCEGVRVVGRDDALVSHSTVQLPVDSFMRRIQSLADDLSRVWLPRLPAHASPEEIVKVCNWPVSVLTNYLDEFKTV